MRRDSLTTDVTRRDVTSRLFNEWQGRPSPLSTRKQPFQVSPTAALSPLSFLHSLFHSFPSIKL